MELGAGFGGIVEAVVGAGEAFAVGDHQVGSGLVIAIADGFEALAHGLVVGIVGVGFEECSGEGKIVEAISLTITEIILK